MLGAEGAAGGGGGGAALSSEDQSPHVEAQTHPEGQLQPQQQTPQPQQRPPPSPVDAEAQEKEPSAVTGGEGEAAIRRAGPNSSSSTAGGGRGGGSGGLRVCRNLSETGYCQFGDRCRFSHSEMPNLSGLMISGEGGGSAAGGAGGAQRGLAQGGEEEGGDQRSRDISQDLNRSASDLSSLMRVIQACAADFNTVNLTIAMARWVGRGSAPSYVGVRAAALCVPLAYLAGLTAHMGPVRGVGIRISSSLAHALTDRHQSLPPPLCLYGSGWASTRAVRGGSSLRSRSTRASCLPWPDSRPRWMGRASRRC